MNNHNASEPSPLMGSNTYSPSVPISVYRELVAEMQATQAMLDSLNIKYQELTTQNQQLLLQNQQLQREIDQVVQTVLRMQQLSGHQVGVSQTANGTPANSLSSPAYFPQSPTVGAIADDHSMDDHNDDSYFAYPPNKLLTEQAQEHYRPHRNSQQMMRIGRFWPIIVIILVVASAFGIGYSFARPFLFKK